VSPGSAEQVAINEHEIRRRGDVRVTLGNTGAPSIRDLEPLSQVRVLLTKPVLRVLASEVTLFSILRRY